MITHLKRIALQVVYATLACFSWITGVSPWINTMASSNWHQSSAKILFSEHQLRRGRGETKVNYQFDVGGVCHHGNRLTFWKWAVNWDRSIDARIANQDCVSVYYDPNDPTRNVLYREIDKGRAWLSLAPIIYLLFVLWLATSAARNLMVRQPA